MSTKKLRNKAPLVLGDPRPLTSAGSIGMSLAVPTLDRATVPHCPFCGDPMQATTQSPFLQTYKCDHCRADLSRRVGDWHGGR